MDTEASAGGAVKMAAGGWWGGAGFRWVVNTCAEHAVFVQKRAIPCTPSLLDLILFVEE